MGKFNDFYQAIKTAVADGFIPYGGTIGPTAAEFPVLIAQFIRGGSFPVPDNDTLRDLPVPIMQRDMMITVSAHNDGGTNFLRTTYFLNEVPPVRLSESGANILDYWQPFSVQGGGDPIPGTNGWTPVFGSEADGSERVVRKLLDYIGGTGTKPAIDPTNRYEGPSGLVAKTNATNYKGSKGDPGPAGPLSGLGVWTKGNMSQLASTLEVANKNGYEVQQSDLISPSKACSFLVLAGMKWQQDTNVYDAFIRIYLQVEQNESEVWTTIARAAYRPYLNGETAGMPISVFQTYSGLAGIKYRFRLTFDLDGGGGSYRDEGYLFVVGLHNTTF